jgi:hypothetical protein
MTVREGASRWLRTAAFASVATLAGCSGTVGHSAPVNGALTVDFMPRSATLANLTLLAASVHLESVAVLGDVTPDARSMIADVSVDALGPGESTKLATIPQGVYSRVRFNVEHLAVQGTWRNLSLSVQLDNDDSSALPVDLSSPDGVDVTPGHDGTVTVTIDVAGWFGNALLDGATAAGGQIVVDRANNVAVAQKLRTNVATSFALQDAPVP